MFSYERSVQSHKTGSMMPHYGRILLLELMLMATDPFGKDRLLQVGASPMPETFGDVATMSSKIGGGWGWFIVGFTTFKTMVRRRRKLI